jgi:double-stranded uracil-DNA glycosylase
MNNPMTPWRPTRLQIEAARGRRVPELLAPGLHVIFCGINPSFYSAAVGHHFARPGNRFWPALFAAGFTERLLSPFEDGDMLRRGYGLTNLVPKATARAEELTGEELQTGGRALLRKLRRHGPRFVAFLGVSAFRTAFGKPRALLGRQPDLLAGATVWVLPSPSGLNAHYRLNELARLYAGLRQAAGIRC